MSKFGLINKSTPTKFTPRKAKLIEICEDYNDQKYPSNVSDVRCKDGVIEVFYQDSYEFASSWNYAVSREHLNSEEKEIFDDKYWKPSKV